MTARVGVAVGRDVDLDGVRGAAVVLLLVDHVLVVVQARWGWVLWLRVGLTRPALPLFMVVSGVLMGRQVAGGAVASVVARRQARRVLPWAVAASLVCVAVPGFGWPDPLLVYVAVLPLVGRVGLRWPLVGAVGGFLFALDVPWPVVSYPPGEVFGWLCVGVLCAGRVGAFRWGGRLWSWVPAAGRRSVEWYVGELVLLAAVCVVLSVRVAG